MKSNRLLLVDFLREISTLEPDHFKSRAYGNASYVLSEKLSDKEFDERTSFLDLECIGQSINSKILEFKKTESIVPRLVKLREEQSSFLDPKYYKVRKNLITKKIKYQEAHNLTAYILSNLSSDTSVQFLGSYRRKSEYVADIDIIVLKKDYKETLDSLVRMFDGIKVTVSGETKTSFIINNNNNTVIDVVVVPEVSIPFSVLHFTGSASHNIKLRNIAKNKGWLLNQYGIYNSTTNERLFLDIISEEDIFTKLGVPYVSPEKR